MGQEICARRGIRNGGHKDWGASNGGHTRYSDFIVRQLRLQEQTEPHRVNAESHGIRGGLVLNIKLVVTSA